MLSKFLIKKTSALLNLEEILKKPFFVWVALGLNRKILKKESNGC